LDRIAEAFVWPVRDPTWPSKVVIMALTLLIPIAGAINGLGWMLATLDRLRAGEERLPPANLRYLGRGIRLFAVQIVYVLGIVAITAVFYVPALLVFVREGRGTANLALVSVGLLLNLLSFSITTLGSVALTFVMPAIVLATDRNGIAAGLRVGKVLRRARASMVNTLIAGLMLIAANFIGSLGLVACGIGVVFTAAYALAMQAWIIRSFELGAGPTAGA
jgi:uncharacterized protein DUF4013